MVVHDAGDLLERQHEHVVVHLGAVDGPPLLLLAVVVGAVVEVEVRGAPEREHHLPGRAEGVLLRHGFPPGRDLALGELVVLHGLIVVVAAPGLFAALLLGLLVFLL